MNRIRSALLSFAETQTEVELPLFANQLTEEEAIVPCVSQTIEVGAEDSDTISLVM